MTAPAEVLAVALLALTGCTKTTIYYCDENTPCEITGTVCNLEQNTCVTVADAAPDGDNPDADATCPSAGGRIAFYTNRDGSDEIAVILADGTDYQKLAAGTSPVWSPDGSKIAGRTDEIFVMNSNGSDQHNVSSGASTSLPPRWSADSTRLVFESPMGLATVNTDGSGLQYLTMPLDADREPNWSPQGSYIVFVRDPDFPAQVYVMDSDGTNQTQLTNLSDGYSYNPSWSPTQQLISWEHSGPPGSGLWTMTPIGLSQTMITSDGPTVDMSTWSPDGTKLAYRRSGDILVVSSVGTGSTNVTNGLYPGASAPRWSPDGTHLAFQTNGDGNWEIYSILPDGTGATNLTNSAGDDRLGSWGPCP